ncbi:MAG: ABC transporter substrate-binding protein [Acidimicrobiia bacterium]
MPELGGTNPCDSGAEWPADRRDVDRRQFLGTLGKAAAAVGAFSVLGPACGGSSSKSSTKKSSTTAAGTSAPATGTGSRDVSGMPKKVKVGVVAPFDGLGSFLGNIMERSLGPAMQHIKDAGLFPGIEIELVKQNAKAEELEQGATKAYTALAADPEVIGIIWGTPYGLKTLAPVIQRDNTPVISVFGDEWTFDRLYPQAPTRSLFQMLVPDKMAADKLLEYAAKDRKYASAALLHDSFVYPDMKYVAGLASKHGIELVSEETFSLSSADYGAQLGRLSSKKPHCMLIWGLAENTAGIVKQLDAVKAGYVDTPTAKSGEWHPHIMGSPGGTGERRWAQLAGPAAKSGSLTCWYASGFTVGLPQFPMYQWMSKYTNTYPSGGEDIPPDALWALLESARVAKSIDRAAMVDALEHFRGKFAGLEFSFTKDRHLSIRDVDLALVSLERVSGPTKTDPAYALGKEATETWPKIDPEYAGPTLLVRPTLESMKSRLPDLAKVVLEQGYGVQCTKHPVDARGLDVKMTAECKVH